MRGIPSRCVITHDSLPYHTTISTRTGLGPSAFHTGEESAPKVCAALVPRFRPLFLFEQSGRLPDGTPNAYSIDKAI